MLLCKDLIDRSSPPLSEVTSEGNQCILYKESKAVTLTTVLLDGKLGQLKLCIEVVQRVSVGVIMMSQ